MWDFFIRNNRFAYLFLIALIGVGSYSIISIPKESAPEVEIPVGVVTTFLPGAPAADVESLVTNEIERGLNNLQNVKEITSTSREGVSNITIEFEADANIDDSIDELKDEVDLIQSSLPDNAEDSSVSEVSFVDQPIMTVAVSSADLTNQEFTQLGDELETEIESVAGVSRVEVSGVRERQVSVIVNPSSLSRFNLSLSDVTNAISGANQSFPIGQIINDGVAYNVAFEGDIEDTSQVAEIAIISRNGQPIYVKDVAVVEDGLADTSLISRLSIGGEPSQQSATIDVYKQSGGDITVITSSVNDKIDELKQSGNLLDNIETATILDSGDQIRQDLVRLSGSGLQTVVLVVLLLVAAIGWREGLLAGAAIPLSFLFGFIGLYFSGNTINFLSLFSLILGIGILVDSAIVMVEGINRKMKDDPTIDKKEAAISTIHEFSSPLISGTLTTVSMFVGLFIVSGVTGQFIASIPFTLIFLLFASLFVALAILPLIASTFLHRHNSKLNEKQITYARKLEAWYRKKLSTVIGKKNKENKFLATLFALLVFAIFLPINVVAGLICAPLTYLLAMFSYKLADRRHWSELKRKLFWWPSLVATLVLATMLTSTFLPSVSLVKVIFFDQSDVDYLIVELEEPEGTVKEITDISVRRTEEILYQIPEIESFTVTVGSGSAFGSGGSGEKLANIFINLDTDRERTSTEIVTDLRSRFSQLNDLDITINQPSEGPPTGAAVVIKFLGNDLTVLTDLANQAAREISALDNTVNVQASTNNNSTEFVINLDRDRASALGVNSATVSQIARTAVFGSEATSLTTLNEDIDVVVKLNLNNADAQSVNSESTNLATINDLINITVPTPNGPVALSTLADISLRESSSVINHEGGQRVVTITADVSDGGNAREIQANAINAINDNLTIPEGVTLSSGGGETEESNQAFLEMFLALVVGVLLMICVLTLQFNSFRHTGYVLSILPYSLIGILFGLAITQNTLSFPSMMGFIALSGIVVNNSILLIDQMNQNRRRNDGRSIIEIVLDASASRIRPILLTTLTTVIGMVPLTYAGDLWSPLAYAVMFGLVFSVIITLVLIPIIYARNPGKIEPDSKARITENDQTTAIAIS